VAIAVAAQLLSLAGHRVKASNGTVAIA